MGSPGACQGQTGGGGAAAACSHAQRPLAAQQLLSGTVSPAAAGFNVETVEYKNISFTVWDVGGQDKVCWRAGALGGGPWRMALSL